VEVEQLEQAVDLAQRIKRRGPARRFRNEGGRGSGERSFGAVEFRLLGRHQRKPVALRRGVFGNQFQPAKRSALSERSLEVEHRERPMDLGWWVRSIRPGRHLRDTGSGRSRKRPRRAIWLRLLEGCQRESLALRRFSLWLVERPLGLRASHSVERAVRASVDPCRRIRSRPYLCV
jgi:hypothetical protein